MIKKIILTGLMLISCIVLPALSSADTSNKKIGIVIFEGVLTSEVTAPVEVFGYKDSGFDVYLISEKKGTVITHEGLKLQVDFTFKKSPQMDILIVPSSYDVEGLISNTVLINFVKAQGANVEYLASNCAGAYVMGAAGLLDGRKVVTYVGGGAGLKAKFPKADVVDDEENTIMVDGNYISSNGGLVSYQSAFKLLEMVKGKSVADERKTDTYFNRLIK